MDDVIFAAHEAAYRYPGAPRDAVAGVDLAISGGELIAFVGPNGSGKTTLLRLLLGVLAPSRGRVTVFGRDATSWSRRELARRIGVVPQREEPVFPLRVRQTVRLGRYPHLGPFEAFDAEDTGAVERALAWCDATALANRWTSTLSGGEWQRVRLARALAQEPDVLVLDEPTANLDVRHEMDVFELVARQVRERGLTGVVVTHHVNLAARFADRMVVMDRGEAVAAGAPRDVFTRETLERVFAWPLEITTWRSVPQLVPLRLHETQGETA